MNAVDHDPFLGLICGFSFAGGKAVPVGWNDMTAAIRRTEATVWLHFRIADRRSQQFIEGCADIPEPVRAFLLARDARVRLEVLAGGVAGVLPDLRVQDDADSVETGLVRIYCNERMLLSVRPHPVQTMDRLRVAIEHGGEIERGFDLLVMLIRAFDGTFDRMIAALETSLDRVEDLVLASHVEAGGRALGRLRRDLVALRRQISPHRHALGGLLPHLPHWVDADGAAQLRAIQERFNAHHQELEHMQESARLLQDELASRQSEMTNRNLYFLSIATAIFLPMTLVTGIFGMNVAGMPGLRSSAAFWLVMAGLLVTGAVSLIVLRLRRLI